MHLFSPLLSIKLDQTLIYSGYTLLINLTEESFYLTRLFSNFDAFSFLRHNFKTTAFKYLRFRGRKKRHKTFLRHFFNYRFRSRETEEIKNPCIFKNYDGEEETKIRYSSEDFDEYIEGYSLLLKSPFEVNHNTSCCVAEFYVLLYFAI